MKLSAIMNKAFICQMEDLRSGPVIGGQVEYRRIRIPFGEFQYILKIYSLFSAEWGC